MWSWISNIFSGILSFLVPFYGRRQGKLIFVGLDNAGKSSLLFRLKEDKMASLTPTGRSTSESLQFGNTTFTTYDLGGHVQARRVWKDYYPAADGIIFVIDGSDKMRFQETKVELEALLENEDVATTPFAVLVNKIDLPNCVSEQQVICEFGLYGKTTGQEAQSKSALQGKRPLEVFPVSVLKRQGYGKAFLWLAKFMD